MRIPEPRAFDRGSKVRVVLRDTSLADALHPAIADATAYVDSPEQEIDVTLDVQEGQLDSRHRYSLWAHVDHRGSGELREDDLITTVDIPVTAEDVATERVVEIPLKRI